MIAAAHPSSSPDQESRPTTRLPLLLRRLVDYGFDLTRRLIQPPAETSRYQRPAKATPRAEPLIARIERALTWALALADILAGTQRFTYRPRTPPTQPHPAPIPGLNAGERFASERYFPVRGKRFMRQAFATQPIGTIVTTICQDLGITKTSELWPADLVALTQTPAEWSRQLHTSPPNTTPTNINSSNTHTAPPPAPPPSPSGTAPLHPHFAAAPEPHPRQ